MPDAFLSHLLPRFSFSTETFFAGEFCGTNKLGTSGSMGQMHFVRSGVLRMEHADGSMVSVTEPTLILYPKPYYHRLVVPDGAKAELVCANVEFKEALRNPFARALPPYLVVSLDALDGVGSVLGLLFSEASKKSLGQRFIMDRLCDILVFQLIRYAMDTGHLQPGVLAAFSDPGIARALTSLHDNPSREFRVDTLASEASMSRSKFAKKFHDLVGMSPAAYVTEWRLTLAENLLKENQAVKVVSAAVGYRTPQSFTRAFVERNGVPPTEWIRKHLQVDA
jgi:AraC-like DNA-binding protein